MSEGLLFVIIIITKTKTQLYNKYNHITIHYY